MSNKKIVKFLRGHGRFNAGEIAGFEADVALKLVRGDNPVAKPYDPNEKVLTVAIDTSEINLRIEEAGAEIDLRLAELGAREQALAEREAELTAGLAAMAQAADAQAVHFDPAKSGDPAPAATPAEDPKPAKKSAAGAPPKQGGK